MGQALYRKYRSKTLDEIVGQEHVTTTLANALKQGRISHAYLLSGPRGVGKTSIARILAHEINGLPYTEDETHLDIIEIDAASNRRIDEIRDLRDRVHVAPVSSKYKVYIIDEVHMLTKEAFNALLKTLEEPPEHVIFILATTEAHKLPDTIVSRTQRYSLRPVPLKQVVSHLKEIAAGEKIAIDDDALELIAQHGDGSFRDSISLLDQASATAEKVTKADVERLLGLAPADYIARLLYALQTADSNSVIKTLGELNAQGLEPAMVAVQLGSAIRTQVLDGTAPAGSLDVLRSLLDVPAARQPQQLLELILLKSLPTANQPQTASIPQPVTPVIIEPVPETPQLPVTKPEEPQPTAESTADSSPPAGVPAENAADFWQQVLDAIKKQYNTLYGIARMAVPRFEQDKLVLAFTFAFHQKRLSEPKNRKILEGVVEQLAGTHIAIICEVATAQPATVAAQPDLAAISNIFGDGVVVES